MATGVVTNAIGSLGGLDKLIPNKNLGEIDTSGSQNKISLDDENIPQSPEDLEKLKQESETTVKQKFMMPNLLKKIKI